MRLRELREDIENIGTDFELIKKTLTNGYIEVHNINRLNEKIFKFEQYGFFEETITKFKNHSASLYNYRGGTLRAKPEELANYEQLVKELKLQIGAVISAIDIALPPQELNSISVKLPDYTRLKKVGKFITDIEKIFSSILPPNLNAEIKLKTFDTGSNWLEIIVSNEESIKFIGIFVDITCFKACYINS